MKLVSLSERRLALAFSDYLSSIGLANHVQEEEGAFSVILEHEPDLSQARQELDDFLSAPMDPRYWQASWQSGHVQDAPVYGTTGTGLSRWLQRAGPVTRLVLLLCVITFAALNLSPEFVFNGLRYPEALRVSAISPEWWRLLTPAIMHFSFMHVAFNLLWWWELGGLIERGQSGRRLLGVAVVIALVSNAAQGAQYGSGFGGLSGVIYGLLGYLWLYPVLNPAAGFRVRREILWFMLGWLALGYTGLLDVIFGPVSNVGHLSGLLTGMVLGVVVGLVNRGQVTRGMQG